MKKASYIIMAVCALSLICAAVIFSGGMPWLYFDIPSIIITAVFTVVILRATWKFKDMGAAFKAVLSEKGDRAVCEDAALFFKTARQCLLGSGFMAFFLGLIAILKNLQDKAKLGPNFAVALLSLFYSIVLSLIVSLPLEAAARRKLNVMKGNE